MAMRGLVEGDCGGQNPLTKLRGHFTQDRGRVEDRFLQPHQLPGPPPAQHELTEQGLVTEFLHETHQVAARGPPTTFRMDTLLQELRHIDGVTKPTQGQPVAALLGADNEWADEYLQNQQNVINWSEQYIQENNLAEPDTILTTKGESGWAEDYLANIPVIDDIQQNNHDIDPEEYERFIASLDNQKGARSALEVERTSEREAVDWANEFVTLAKSDLENNLQPPQETYKQEFWRNLEEEWRSVQAETEDHPWLSEFSSNYEPFSEYQFQENNSATENFNALEEGKRKLKEGDLPSAVLLFEAAVQQDPASVEGWLLLGRSQAENEQDPQAIAALKKCLSLDPGNLSALLSIAVSFTNESYQAQACHALQLWLQNSEQYSHLVTERLDDKLAFTTSFMPEEMHSKITNLYIQAARLQQREDLDPNIQTGLGILFNLSSDYDKAVDCFKAALAANPDDSLLWNRLGATLANGNRSEEAVAAYHNALRHNPGFVRCRYNLGISCINLKAYQAAAEHFLTALNFQATGQGPKGAQSESAMSDTIWSSLRLAVSLLNRPDLKELTDRKDLAKLSSEFNINLPS